MNKGAEVAGGARTGCVGNRVGYFMLRKVGALLVCACSLGVAAVAADPPGIIAGPANSVPQCVTPGRLIAFVKQRNNDLNARYDGIATEYMRLGERLGVRWDYAFYQMIVE